MVRKDFEEKNVVATILTEAQGEYEGPYKVIGTQCGTCKEAKMDGVDA